ARGSGDRGSAALSAMTGREEIPQAPDELGRDLAAGKTREIQRLELVRHMRSGDVGVVDAHRQDEERALGDVARAVDRVAPLAAEVALEAALGGRRNDRHEVRAAREVALDLPIVVVAALETVEIE